MIKAHFHKYRNRQYCHIYSDIGLSELFGWMVDNNISTSWVQFNKFPHLDLWGSKIQKYTKGLTVVDNHQFIKDVRIYKKMKFKIK